MHTQQLKNEIITSLDILPTESLEFLARFILFLKGQMELLPTSMNSIATPKQDQSPLTLLGQTPIDDKVTDASTHHDRYIYEA